MTRIRRTQPHPGGGLPGTDRGGVRFGILGSGHVGTEVARALLGPQDDQGTMRGATVVLTRRTSGAVTRRPLDAAHAAQPLGPGAIWHHLDLVGTTGPRGPAGAGFSHVPRLFAGCRVVLVTFPVTGDGEPSQSFYAYLRDALATLVESGTAICLLSSTSAYLQPSGVVTESSAWDSEHPRYAAEEELRQQLGATVIPLAGLFGHGRDPLRWLADGRIKDLSGAVNLIHHEDAGLCVATILSDPLLQRGERINVATGELHWWAELALVHRITPAGMTPAQVADALSAARYSQSTGGFRARLISNDKLLERYGELRSLSFRRVGN